MAAAIQWVGTLMARCRLVPHVPVSHAVRN